MNNYSIINSMRKIFQLSIPQVQRIGFFAALISATFLIYLVVLFIFLPSESTSHVASNKGQSSSDRRFYQAEQVPTASKPTNGRSGAQTATQSISTDAMIGANDSVPQSSSAAPTKKAPSTNSPPAAIAPPSVPGNTSPAPMEINILGIKFRF